MPELTEGNFANYGEAVRGYQNSLVLESIHRDVGMGMQQLGEYLPRMVLSADGLVYWVLAKPAGSTSVYAPPFAVSPVKVSNSWYVEVRWGEVNPSWAASGQVPTLGGTTLSVSSPPRLAISSGDHTLYGRLVVTPTSVARGGGYALSSVTTSAEWDFDFHSTTDARLPSINEETGAVVQTGIFYAALAVVSWDGSTTPTVTQTRYGPWSVGFCASSASIQILPGPVATISIA